MMYDVIVDKNDGDGMKDDRWKLTPHYMFEYAETILLCTLCCGINQSKRGNQMTMKRTLRRRAQYFDQLKREKVKK